MPIVKISLLAGRTVGTKQAIAKEVTYTLVHHTSNKAEHIYIVFEDVPKTNWAVAGELFSNMTLPKE